MVKTYYYAVDKDGQGWYYDNPPIFDGESWNVDPRKEGLFWSEEDFNFDFDKLLGTVKFPELNKGERIEMNLQFEFGIK